MADQPADAASSSQPRLRQATLLFLTACTLALLSLPTSLSQLAAASLRTPPAAAPPPAAPAVVLFGDSIDFFMVSDWCRRRAPNFSLCFDSKVWTGGVSRVLPSDNCTGYQELLDTLADPWSIHAGFMSCLPNWQLAPLDAPVLLSMYNVWGALNRRPPGISPRPPDDMTLHEIWTPTFSLIPRLLHGRRPNAFVVQALFWDLLFEQNVNRDYSALTDEGGTLLPAWVKRYGRSAGELLDITAELTRDWPLVLSVWRTSNEVNSSGDTGWQQGANGLIRRANAAAAEAAAQRGVGVFGALAEGAVPLRDKHHPSEPVAVATMDRLLADVAQRGRGGAAPKG